VAEEIVPARYGDVSVLGKSVTVEMQGIRPREKADGPGKHIVVRPGGTNRLGSPVELWKPVIG
jgi:hypothetical protein